MRGELPVGYSSRNRCTALPRAWGTAPCAARRITPWAASELRLGKLGSSRTHLERAIALSDAETRATAYTYSGHDPTVCCLGYLGVNLWVQRLSGPGPATSERGARVGGGGRASGQHRLAHTMMTWVRVLRGEGRGGGRARRHGAGDRRLAMDSPTGPPLRACFRGWIAARAGTNGRGRGATCGLRHLPGDRTRRRPDGLPGRQARTSACGLGDTRDGLRAIDEALRFVALYEERSMEAELHRMRGRAVAAGRGRCSADARGDRVPGRGPQDRPPAGRPRAGAPRRAGVEPVLAQGRARGRCAAAARDVCGRFTEGAETADLRAAQALLAGG
jgi:adenylate cyclase